MKPKLINEFINCDIWFLLNHPVNVVNIFWCQGVLASSLGCLCFYGTCFAHLFFQAVNSTGIYRKTFRNFFCVVCFVPGFNKQFSCFIM